MPNEANNSSVSSGDNEKSLELIYNHLLEVWKKEWQASLSLKQRAERLVGLSVVLLGGMSYALGHLEWANDIWWAKALVFLLGIAAFIELFRTVWECVYFIFPQEEAFVGSSKLNELLWSGKDIRRLPVEFLRDLSKSLSSAIECNRSILKSKGQRSDNMKKFAKRGLLLSSFFVLVSLAGESVGSMCMYKEKIVENEKAQEASESSDSLGDPTPASNEPVAEMPERIELGLDKSSINIRKK